MKALKTLLIAVITLAGIAISTKTSAQPGFRANVSFNTFYSELSPYGRWVNMPRYGQVWIYRESNFRPYYSNGNWIDTDLGWSWNSGYPWGWATFHYGRWEFDPAYGWFWIPGYEYAPAWVVWSEVDDYYGWAPLGFGVDINISIGRIPSNRWMYAPRGRIAYHHIDRYCLPYERNHVYYGRQRPIVNVYVHNNVRYERGPARPTRGNASRPDYRRPNYERPNNDRGRPDNRRPDYGRNDNRRYDNDNNGNNRRYERPDNDRRQYENNRGNGNYNNRGNGNRSDNRRNNLVQSSPSTSNNAPVLQNRQPNAAFENFRKMRTTKAEVSR